MEGARILQEQALTILKELDSEGSRLGIGHVLNRLGIIALQQGEYERAGALTQEALDRFRAMGDQDAVANTLNNLGVLAVEQGDYGQARGLYAEALAMHRESGDAHSAAIYLGNLGEVARHEGDLPVAAAHYREALTMWSALKDRWNVSAALDGVAGLAIDAGRAEVASRLLGAASALREAIGASLPPNENAGVERDRKRASEALGPVAFAAAEAAGRSLSAEDTMAEALALAEHLTTISPESSSVKDAGAT